MATKQYKCLSFTVYCFRIPLQNFSLIWIDYFTVLRPAQEFFTLWIRHHCLWMAAKFRPMLGAQGLWVGRDLYRATSAVTRDLCFSGLIQRTAQFSRLLWRTRGCGGFILTQILTGPPSSGEVTIVGEGLQNLGLYLSTYMACEQEGIFIVPHLL
jgi:hypothetical protein